MAEAAIGVCLPLVELAPRERLRFSAYALSEFGCSLRQISSFLGIPECTARTWRNHFSDGPSIWDAPRSGRPRLHAEQTEQRVVAFYCQTPLLPGCGKGRWSLRTAEHHLRLNPSTVDAAPSRSTLQRMLARQELRPHRVRYFLQITDPDFFPKMEDLLELYRSDVQNLFCFDECPGLQVLQRIAPDMRPGPDEADPRWRLSEFEYIRNGTLDVFAFLDVRSGRVEAECHGDHTKSTFLAAFRRHAAALPADESVHYVMDNLAAHSSYEFCCTVAELSSSECPEAEQLSSVQERRAWLRNPHKRIVIHFTPFHGSWLNLVEIWFRIMGRACLSQSYDHPDQMRDAILEYADVWSEQWAHPFQYSYDGDGLHRKAVSRFCVMLRQAPGDMTPQFITKQSLLMVNLLDRYHDEVPLPQWQELSQAVTAAEPSLWDRIRHCTRPIVRSKAADALRSLISHLAAREARGAA